MSLTNNFRSAALIRMVLIVSAMTLSQTSCEQLPSLVIESGKPVRFITSGLATIIDLQISGPDLEREPHPQGDGNRLPLLKVYWEFASLPSQERSLDQIAVVTYGQVPQGFVQVQPLADSPPLPLVERNLYNITLSFKDGGKINRFFKLQDGKIVAEGE